MLHFSYLKNIFYHILWHLSSELHSYSSCISCFVYKENMLCQHSKQSDCSQRAMKATAKDGYH